MRPEEELKWLQKYDIDVYDIDDLKNIKVLSLPESNLKKFPKFEHLNNLKELYLEGNQLTEFSGNYPELEWLDISRNQLIKFSGEYPKLKVLVLAKNQLTKFSGEYPRLIKLNLEHNESLKSFTAKVPNLEHIFIKETELYGNSLKLDKDVIIHNNTLLKLCIEIEKELRR